jgi:hypothetical protein
MFEEFSVKLEVFAGFWMSFKEDMTFFDEKKFLLKNLVWIRIGSRISNSLPVHPDPDLDFKMSWSGSVLSDHGSEILISRILVKILVKLTQKD